MATKGQKSAIEDQNRVTETDAVFPIIREHPGGCSTTRGEISLFVCLISAGGERRTS
ncbi:hypothetical protein [Paenibacillus thalictri]|uniref:hypothetical protein n=1 Tax=Paenibacillus thalictri TaxID=2527873 RepID=UPI0013EF21BE|nr:hypothetical protein [Paenibacillus thalictri]